MKLKLVETVVLSLAAGSQAWEPRGHEYRPARPTDSESFQNSFRNLNPFQ